jgi:sigma-E factor negative regulatory protein RseA
MNQSNQESLSALMDGELSDDQLRFLLRGLEHDGELRQTWSRYHLIRDGLRRELPATLSAGFADGVMARLDISETVARGGGRRRWLQWSAGGAIAAGVAAVALMVSQPHATAPTAPSGPRMADAQPASRSAGAAAPASPSAPVAPSWLTPNGPTWTTQPASATYYGGGQGGNVVMPAAYSRQLAPYMSLRNAPQVRALRSHGQTRYVMLEPAQPPPARAQ